MTDEERCRAEFEEWYFEGFIPPNNRDENGDYSLMSAYNAWNAWQACWKLCGGMKDE